MVDMASFIVGPGLPLKTRKFRLCSTRPLRASELRACEGAPAANLVAPEEDKATVVRGPVQSRELVAAPSLGEYAEQRAAGLISPFIPRRDDEWTDAWALAVAPRKAQELKNQYSRVGILIERNFPDFGPAPSAEEQYSMASIEDISRAKARVVYEATGLPSIAETHDLAIDPPESGSKMNKTLQQGYYTRNVEVDGDIMIDRVRPISDENRATRFYSCVAYFDGEMEIVTHGSATVAITFSAARYATIAIACAFDELYKILSRRLGLTLCSPGPSSMHHSENDDGSKKKLAGATMLRERLMREGKMLKDGIIKVSSFLNHMVDVDLMEECGLELAERLRATMPNKVLTVESTGLIPGLPTARKLGIPLVFARKSRPITISDSYQTTYRSATKGVTAELVVSCEYLQAGDRVLIIDDFLAGGSTAEALFKLANMAHAKVVGVGVLIEKMSSGGRAFLSGYDVPVESLAKIADDAGSPERIAIVEEEPWEDKNVVDEQEQARQKVIAENAREYEEQQLSPTELGMGDLAAGENGQDMSVKMGLDADSDQDVDIDDDTAVVDIDDNDDDDTDEFDILQEKLIRSAPR